ncbi:GDP-mannose 4,6-dehydratase [Solirubrobacter soli]|uniref:GDP-mannose 4,6-dehydratase n=1 Tax=Solirubrobacter soli TaxID=363832 RepID=UPI0003F88114|nr:GDP-mannose 4,6-dehydratase [Solirubrobacter soli]
MSRRVLITGATGFAGRHLVAACEAGGDEVISAPPSVALDLRDPAATARLVADARPDVVYHLAARAHVGQSWQDPIGTLSDNVAMTAAVLEAVKRAAPDAVVISVGSGEEYGPPETVPTTEAHPLRPQNPYAVSKASSGLLARFYADAHGLRVIHARAFNHAGPGQEPIYAIANFARQFAENAGDDPITIVTGSPDTRRDFTDVRDVVRAYRLLAERGVAGAVLNVCSGVTRSARELLVALGEVAGVAVDHQVDPAKVRAHEVFEIRGANDAIEAATGWRPEIPLETTLRDTLAWWRGRQTGD